jgi:hypothetical protein
VQHVERAYAGHTGALCKSSVERECVTSNDKPRIVVFVTCNERSLKKTLVANGYDIEASTDVP